MGPEPTLTTLFLWQRNQRKRVKSTEGRRRRRQKLFITSDRTTLQELGKRTRGSNQTDKDSYQVIEGGRRPPLPRPTSPLRPPTTSRSWQDDRHGPILRGPLGPFYEETHEPKDFVDIPGQNRGVTEDQDVLGVFRKSWWLVSVETDIQSLVPTRRRLYT